MSKTLHLKDEVCAICAKAGLDPKSVSEFRVTPEAIVFEVFMEPKQLGAEGPLTVIVTHPWTWEAE